LKALELAKCSGKLLVFNSSLPVNEAPGRLKTKDEHKLLGTDREKTAFRPQTSYYEKLGKECAKSGVRVDLFLAHNGFIDLATIGQVARLTSGQVRPIFKNYFFSFNFSNNFFLDLQVHSVSSCPGW